MALNKVCSGAVMDYLNESGATITSGEPVLIGATLGVALVDIADDATGSVAIEEVYEIRKATGAIGQGDLVYWDADGNPAGSTTENGWSGTGCLTTTSSGNTLAGRAYAAAASDDTTVQIKLNA
ncbi:MAG: DUF2190 family protein [Proteobacteria bacterium]|nr:DUF2190 family protein [Pseudomonadota bacterium]MBU1594254.1 DUF2190 family protein [Pseudomonadota bacterium]